MTTTDYLTLPLRQRLQRRKEIGEESFRKYAPAYGGIWTNEGNPLGDFAEINQGWRLRDIRPCDKVANSIRHKGWYIDGYCQDTIHGMVYRLPHGLFGIAIQDSYGNPPLVVREVFSNEIAAARAADRAAEIEAGRQKRANCKYHAEERVAEIRAGDLMRVRTCIANLCEGIRQSTLHPAACAGLKAQLKSLLREKAQLWEEVRRLEREPWTVYPC